MKFPFAVPAVLSVFAIAFFSSAGHADTDTLAPARIGQLQCYTPNAQHKTCRALAAYSFDAGGNIQNDARVLLIASPAIVMHTVTPVVLRNNAVCGVVRDQDIDSATFEIAGQAASDDTTALIREEIKSLLGPRLGKELCTTYAQSGDQLTASAAIDGVPEPSLSDVVVWVNPNDGYVVAP